jgi:1-deoxy-D-xylulose-5-phosphate reductoisomerase
LKEIIILGSTGSIGTQSLEIIKRNPDKFTCSALCCGMKVDILRKQIDEFRPRAVSVYREEDAEELRRDYPDLEVFHGNKGARKIAAYEGDIVINALVGIRGLIPTLDAMEAGKDIALANKETLVTGGPLTMGKAAEKGVRILPVDSEHSAIFQCLQGAGPNSIEKIYLTASGGPFRGYSLKQLESVTIDDALRHPNWSMGRKVTIDSATMMNKGLEAIEAKYLFDVEPEQIQVVVHPQSIVHSMISFKDGAVIGQLGVPDMGLPIAYALSYPERTDSGLQKMDIFKDAASLTFEEADPAVFKCLRLAFDAMKAGHSYQVAMNAANEIVVSRFSRGRLHFLGIQDTIEKVLERHVPVKIDSAEDVLVIDKEARRMTLEVLDG